MPQWALHINLDPMSPLLLENCIFSPATTIGIDTGMSLPPPTPRPGIGPRLAEAGVPHRVGWVGADQAGAAAEPPLRRRGPRGVAGPVCGGRRVGSPQAEAPLRFARRAFRGVKGIRG